jgi:hypothetical protein
MGKNIKDITIYGLFSNIYLFGLLLFILPNQLYASRYHVLGHKGEDQLIQLKSQYDIAPATVLKLPIDVPQEYISLFGTLPPRLAAITSQTPAGIYGTGDVITIDLEFTTPVLVSGNPTITMTTGCFNEDCQVKEQQSFVCYADDGMFGIRLEDQFIMNIDVNTTSSQLKLKLEELVGIGQVTIKYSDFDDREYSSGDRVCSSRGNNVTITFENVTFPQYNGDVPNLQYSQANNFQDLLTGLSLGGDGPPLVGLHTAYVSKILYQEDRKGIQIRDNVAAYVSGSGTNVLTFSFVVVNGDFTTKLDTKSINFIDGYIYSPTTGANVSTSVPDYGRGLRYMSISPGSLSSLKIIRISNAIPQIISVTSPITDAIYTEADILTVYIIYDLPVKIFNAHLLYITFETGTFKRDVYFNSLINETTLEFIYTVQFGDSSASLDVLSKDAFYLNGGLIYRDTSTNETIANITLPEPGQLNSLAANKFIVVSNTQPLILSVFAPDMPGGVYTSGDDVDIVVTYDYACRVSGNPVLWLTNTPKAMDIFIRTAPANVLYNYIRSLPGETTQLVLIFQLNYKLIIGDSIEVVLPGFATHGFGATTTFILDGTSSSLFTAIYTLSSNTIALTTNSDILAETEINLIVEGLNGLRLPTDGITVGNTLEFSLVSNLVNSTFTRSYPFQSYSSVGFTSTSIAITPKTHDIYSNVSFSFTVGEYLSVDDYIIIHLDGFLCTIPAGWHYEPPFIVTWVESTDELKLLVTNATTTLSFDLLFNLYLKFIIPDEGVGVDTIQISLNSNFNGVLSRIPLPLATSICGIHNVAIEFETKVAGSTSELNLNFKVSPTDLLVGDTIVFVVPEYDSTYGIISRVIDPLYISGSSSSDFTVSIDKNVITLTVKNLITLGTDMQVNIRQEAGLMVPVAGIDSNTVVTGRVYSTTCGLSDFIDFNFAKNVLLTTSPSVVFTPATPVLGSTTDLDFSFVLSDDLEVNDVLYFNIGEFSRVISTTTLDSDTTTAHTITSRLNRLYKRIEVTLGARITAGTTVAISYTGFNVPSNNVPKDTFTLNIISANGYIDGKSMTNVCEGFCTNTAEFSQVFVGAPTVITFFMTYYASLASGSTLTFDLSSYDLAPGESSLVGKVDAVSATVTGTPQVSTVTIVTTATVASNTAFNVSFEKITFFPNARNEPTISFAGFESAFSIPTIYEEVDFSTSSLTFSSSLPDTTSDITLQFNSNQNGLNNGNFIKLSLPNFINETSDITLSNLDTGGNVYDYLDSSSFWNSSNSIMTLYIKDKISQTDILNVKMVGFKLPADGVNVDSVNLGYSLGIDHTTSSPYMPFRSVQEVYSLNNPAVTFGYDSTDATFPLASIVLSFDSSTTILVGDIITFTIPQLVASDIASVTITSTTIVLTSAVYTSISTSFAFLVSTQFSPGAVTIDMDIDGLMTVVSTGISSTDVGTIDLERSSSSIVNTNVGIPCVGICSATCVPLSSKAGFSTSYDISITFGGQQFVSGDTIDIVFTNFVTASTTLDVSSSTRSATDSADITLSWNSGTDTLTITPQVSASPSYTPTYTLDFKILTKFDFALPTIGIVENNGYSITWTSGSRVFQSNTFEITPVNSLSSSSFTISASVPHQPTTLSVACTVSNDLYTGDEVIVILPGFVMDAEVLPTTSLSITADVDAFDVGNSQVNPKVRVKLQQDVSAGTSISFTTHSDAVIKLPLKGVNDDVDISLAITSSASSMATTKLSSIPTVGSMIPASITLPTSQTTLISRSFASFNFDFTVNCNLDGADAVTMIIPNINTPSGSTITINQYDGVANTAITGSWNDAATTLTFTFVDSYLTQPPGTLLRFNVTSDNSFTATNDIVYPNDISSTYSIASTTCPIGNMPFDASSGTTLLSSSINFGVPVISIVSDVTMSILSRLDLIKDDELVIKLEEFTTTETLCTLDSNGYFNETATITSYPSASPPYITISAIVRYYIPAATNINLVLAIDAGITIPTLGVSLNSQDISMTLKRTNTTTIYPTTGDLFTGLFQSTQPIGYFIDKSITITSPTPGADSVFDLLWEISGPIVIGDDVIFYLPNFISALTSVSITGTAATYYTASWDSVNSLFSLTSINSVASSTTLTATISSGFTLPSGGISYPTTDYTISTSAIECTVFSEIISDVSIVPIIQASSITFLASEPDRVSSYVTNDKVIQLISGHGLSEVDYGTQVSIDSVLYTITSISDDLMYIAESYTGATITLASPSTELYTPPIRPAIYVSGTDTTDLVFRYTVARGDLHTNLIIQDSSLSSYITDSLALDAGALGIGTIKRMSATPTVVAMRTLPTLLSRVDISFNADIPQILDVYTTSPTGSFSEGDKFDFNIQFSEEVYIGSLNKTSPILLLNLNNNLVTALYSSGSNSSLLTFVYTIVAADYQLHRDNYLITTAAPQVNPLRVISSFEFNYIRRLSRHPVLDVNIEFPKNVSLSIPSNCSIVGVAPRVINKYIGSNARGDVFTAGDKIHVYIEFDANVDVIIRNTGYMPYVNLDVGRSDPGKAEFEDTNDPKILHFVYEITPDDIIPGALYLKCNCNDYFKRSYILEENGETAYVVATGYDYLASVIISYDETPAALLLSSTFVLSNVQPIATKVYANNTGLIHGKITSPGDVIRISIKFSTNVTVIGMVRLVLRGDVSKCHAHYISGDGTDIIDFLYIVSSQSAIGKLDCNSVSAFDTSLGSIKRLSESPIINVIYTIEFPGTVNSLGLLSDVIIDTTSTASLKIRELTDRPILPVTSIPFTLNDAGGTQTFRLIDTTLNADNQVSINSTLNNTQMKTTFSSSFAEPVELQEIYSYGTSQTYVVEEKYGIPFRSLPEMGVLSESGSNLVGCDWWGLYNLQSILDTSVDFDRRVVAKDSYIVMNTADSLNKAFVVDSMDYILMTIDLRNPSISDKMEQFKLEYKGMLTRCISVSASSKGKSSIQAAIEEVPTMKTLGPNVAMVTNSSGLLLFSLNFTTTPDAEINIVNSQSCTSFTSDRVNIIPSNEVIFRYNVRDTSSILLTSNQDVNTGTYNFRIGQLNNITVTPWGVAADTVLLEHFDINGKQISRRHITTGGVPGVTWSSITFGSTQPNSKTSVKTVICFNEELAIGDEVKVHLENFDVTNSVGGAFNYNTATYTIDWDGIKTITYTSVAVAYCINEEISEDKLIVLPTNGIFKNSKSDVHFSFRAARGKFDDATFDKVSPVGISDIDIVLGNPQQGFNSSVNITFELAHEIKEGGINELMIELPEFFKYDGILTTDKLDIDGPFVHAFTATWVSTHDAIKLVPLYPLKVGRYNVNILATEDNSLTVSKYGITDITGERTPQIEIVSRLWNMTNTKFKKFPRIMGLDIPAVRIGLSRPTEVVTEISFSSNFTRPIIGPATIKFRIPCLTNSRGFSEETIYNNELDTITWREWEKTFYIHRQHGWGMNETFDISLNDVSYFTVNNLGVPYSRMQIFGGRNQPIPTGVTISGEAADGSFMLESPVNDVNIIPTIQSSSVRFSSDDLFNNEAVEINFGLTLNMPAEPGDVFTFDLFSVANYTGNQDKNYTITGECVRAISDFYFSQNDTIRLVYSNTSECLDGRKTLDWKVHTDAGISVPKAIVQTDSDVFKVNWRNTFIDTDYAVVTNIEAFGFITSTVKFDNPKAGNYTDVNFKFITSHILQIGDKIIFKMTGSYTYNHVSTTVVDQIGREWVIDFDSNDNTISFTVPIKLQPSALLFSFIDDKGIILPTAGIVGGIRSNEWTITIARDGVELTPQSVHFLQSVGAIAASTIVKIPIETTGHFNNISLAGDNLDPVKLVVSMTLSSPLNGGDEIIFYAPLYTFFYDEVIEFSSNDADKFIGHIDSMNQLISISPKYDMPSTALSLTIPATKAYSTGHGDCQTTLEIMCTMEVSIISQACPINRNDVFVETLMGFSYSSIHLHTDHFAPTPYPTSQPSNQPSGQPSRQPTGTPTRQPSSQPSSAPTCPTSQPSGQPTALPSRQPSGQPTTQPSSAPTSPTSQPSSQPSGYPTTQPSSQPTVPTSMPSTQPTMQPTGQPSSQPTNQPTSQPTNPTSAPSRPPTPSPTPVPTAKPTIPRRLLSRELLTSAPSGQPSSLPSSQPTGSPSRLPSSQPSSSPSTRPSSTPTNAAVVYHMTTDIKFMLDNGLKTNTVVSIYLPQIVRDTSLNTGEPNIVDKVGAMAAVWSANWDGTNQVLDLTALVDVLPGLQDLNVESTLMIMDTTFIYKDTDIITYKITTPVGDVVEGGVFDHVLAKGLKHSSLSFGNPINGEATSVDIHFEGQGDGLKAGDHVYVYLPNFALPDLTPIVLTGNQGNASMYAHWDSSDVCIVFTITSDFEAVTITVALSNGLVIPSVGVNGANVPTLALRTQNWQLYGPTKFNSFIPLSYMSSSAITFNSNNAGQDVTISFSLGYNSAGFKKWDVFDLFLPKFWSTEQAVFVPNSDSVLFDIEFIPCSEIVRFQANQDSVVSSFALDFKGFRLPIHGVSSDLAGYISISSNASVGNIVSIPVISTQLVSYFSESSIEFSPSIVNSATTMTVKFTLLSTLLVGETVVMVLPGVIIASSTPIISTTGGSFTAAWNSGLETLTITVITANIEAEADLVITFSNNVVLSQEGFPLADSTKFPTLTTTAASGTVDPCNFRTVERVGVHASTIHFGVLDASNEISMRFQFFSSGDITIGDTLLFLVPNVKTVSGTFNALVTCIGDEAENDFTSTFSVHFNEGANTITLTALVADISREYNIFVDFGNGLYLDMSGNQGLTYSLTGVSAIIGTITSRVIDIIPDNLAMINPSGSLNITGCGFDDSCAFEIDLILSNLFLSGESIAISHPNLNRANNIDMDLTLSLGGSGSQYFDGNWRNSDNVNELEVSSSAIIENTNGFIKTATDIPANSVNLTLPSTYLGTTIVSTIPRIVSVYVTESLSKVVCGDSVKINVLFDEPVVVLVGDKLRILLNTNEYAYYFGGNSTNIIVFTYVVTNPTDVADLAAYGPNALETLSTATLSRYGYPAIIANLTIPQPYGSILRSNGNYIPIDVRCSGTAIVITVDEFSKSLDYHTGDVLDVGIAYDRPIEVFGQPHLTLVDNEDGSKRVNLTYINVSSIQLLEVHFDTNYSLIYGDSQTACIAWDDVSTLQSELKTLTDLALSLPMELLTYSVSTGFQYELTFTGFAPEVLQVTTSGCSDGGFAEVTVPFNMLSVATFRYTVLQGLSLSNVSYPFNSSLYTDDENYVYIAGHASSQTTNNILPGLGSTGYPLGEFHAIDIITDPPQVVSVNANFTASLISQTTTDAVSGDNIFITIEYDLPVEVIGTPLLELKFDSYIEGAVVGQTEFTRDIPLYSSTSRKMNDPVSGDNIFVGKRLEFLYKVLVGDVASSLDYLSVDALKLNGSTIKLASPNPITLANYTLPYPDLSKWLSNATLSHINITVAANEPPIIEAIHTDHATGTYGAGEEIIITLLFSSPIMIINSLTDYKEPYVFLGTPSRAKMYYLSGNGTYNLDFKYTIEDGQNTAALSLWGLPGQTDSIDLLYNSKFQDMIGNTWTNMSTNFVRMTEFTNIAIDTVPPAVLYVNSTNDNGIYYPGQSVDLTVVFDKYVCITGVGIPALALFVPHQESKDTLAWYVSGNQTKELHFKYLVPLPNPRVALHPYIWFDYAGVAALTDHLYGTVIREYTMNPITSTTARLPGQDTSYLRYNRDMQLNFVIPQVISVKAINPDGVYTVGDVIEIEVLFSQEVMIIQPPVLRLNTGDIHRNAEYIYGNYTNTLVFSYAIQEFDISSTLDYVDTRIEPYNMVNFGISLALNTDIYKGNTGRLAGNINYDRHNDIILINTEKGGVFRASQDILIPARTDLALPGTSGSLSYESSIAIDTRQPNISRVYADAPTGVYCDRVNMNVYVEFNYKVVVGGCPRLLFQIEGVDRYANYANGSGTTTLNFVFNVVEKDYSFEFDYRNRFSLELKSCTGTEDEESVLMANSPFYIKKMSVVPFIDANLTLPWVKYVESVVAPTSIIGGGSDIMLNGDGTIVRSVWTSLYNSRDYSIGDIIDINIEFGSEVSLKTDTYIELTNLSRPIYYEYMYNSTTAVFPFVIQVNDNIDSLKYINHYSLRTSNKCDITDLDHNNILCVNQDLPSNGLQIPGTSDSLSLKQLHVQELNIEVTAAQFLYTKVFLGQENADLVFGIPKTRASKEVYIPPVLTGAFAEGDRCDPYGSSWLYQEAIDLVGSKRIITTTSCPNHYSVCQSLECVLAGVEYSLAKPKTTIYEIPLYPKFGPTFKDVQCQSGNIAVALNGVGIGTAGDNSDTCENILQRKGDSLDKCGGYADNTGDYRYYVPPSCLLQQLQLTPVESTHSPQIGWSLDGFPVYGPRGPYGKLMKPCIHRLPGDSSNICLDQCNGYAAPVEVDHYIYRYYIAGEVASGTCVSEITRTDGGVAAVINCANQKDPCCSSVLPDYQAYNPFTIGCNRGCKLSDSDCNSNTVGNGYFSAFKPELALFPSVKFDNNEITTQLYINKNASFDLYNLNYLPSVWDLTDTSPTLDTRFTTGSIMTFSVTFSGDIWVEGNPFVELYLNNDILRAFYSHQMNRDVIFSVVIDSPLFEGSLTCTRSSIINLNGGRIMKKSNFLPVLPVELNMAGICCTDTCYATTVQATVPFVTRVYSVSGTFSTPEVIEILIDFSGPVSVIGQPILELDLIETPNSIAVYQYQPDSNTLLFRYTTAPSDYTSLLEYSSSNSLKMSNGTFDGIVMNGIFTRIDANIELPPRGSIGSLGRENTIIINNDRASILSITAVPSQATSGDDITITFLYSEIMLAKDINGDTLLSGLTDESSLSIIVDIVPFSIIEKTIQRVANLVSIVGNEVKFIFRVSINDPTGTVMINNPTPLVFIDSSLKTDRNGADGPTKLDISLLSNALSTVDNEKPSVVRVYSYNTTIKFPWGVGDILDIFVEMNLPVVIKVVPALDLIFDAGSRIAQYIPKMENISGNTFLYTFH